MYVTTTYTWNCRTVDCYPSKNSNTNVIHNVHYKVEGVSNLTDSQGIPYSGENIGT